MKKDKDLLDDRLKACPNCDMCLRYSSNSTTMLGIGGYVITCGRCKFSSGYFPTHEAAVTHWNFLKDLKEQTKTLEYEIECLRDDFYIDK